MDIKTILEKEFTTESALKESNNRVVLDDGSLSIDTFLNKHKDYRKKINDALRSYETSKKEAVSKYQARLELEKKEGKQEVIYQSSIDSLNSGKYYEAYMGFASIIEYKDSKDYHAKCDAILDAKYKEANNLYNNKQFKDALTIFKALVAYKDSANMLRKCESAIEEQNKLDKKNAQLAALNAAKKKKKKIVLSVSGVIAGIVAVVLILTFAVFVPNANKKANQAKYDNALRLINSGSYSEAVQELSNLSYADANKQLLVAKAGLSFESGNYDSGIKNMCDAGGTTEVTYNPNGGTTSVSKETITSYKTISNTSSKDYYTFSEWNIESFKITTAQDNYKCSLKLLANFGATVYKITYTLDGGTNNSDNPSTYTVESQTITLKDPTKNGYKFKGWTLNGNKCTSIPKGSHGDITLVATWTKVYDITYVLNGGTNNSDNPSSFTVDDNITIKDATKEGYKFIGWNDGTTTTKNYVIKNRESNLTLTAVWEANVYVVTLDADGGTYSGESVLNIEYDSNVSLPTPTKPYYSFDGWYYGDTKIGSKWKIASNCTIKAKWNLKILNYLEYSIETNSSDKTQYVKINGLKNGYNESGLIIPSQIDGYDVKRIEENAFKNASCASSITYVEFPNSIERIGKGVLSNFTSLEKLVSPFVGNTRTTSQQYALLGYLFGEDNANTTQHYYANTYQHDIDYFIPTTLKEIKLTDTERIAGYQFSNCVYLEKITPSANLVSIENLAFENCTSLTSFNMSNCGSLATIGNSVFKNLSSIEDLIVPASVTSIGSTAFYNTNVSVSTLPSGLTSIGADAFAKCENITSITIPSGVTKLKGATFNACTNLSSVIIKGLIDEVGSYEFRGCTSLTSISFEGGIKTIGSYMFDGCSALTSITIPYSCKKIENYAFAGYGKTSAIKNIAYNGTKSQWSSNVSKSYNWDTGLSSYTIHCTDGDIAG